jgi:hypothetical protein
LPHSKGFSSGNLGFLARRWPDQAHLRPGKGNR